MKGFLIRKMAETAETYSQFKNFDHHQNSLQVIGAMHTKEKDPKFPKAVHSRCLKATWFLQFSLNL